MCRFTPGHRRTLVAQHVSLVLPEYPVGSEVLPGSADRQIAEGLIISVNTVGNHVRSILNKTDSANRTEAAAYALRRGLGSDEGSDC